MPLYHGQIPQDKWQYGNIDYNFNKINSTNPNDT